MQPDKWDFDGRAIYSFHPDEPLGQVVLIHELPGLSEGCVDLGRRLSENGFAVHMPLLFGEYGQYSPTAGLRQMWCLRDEFEMFRAARTSRIVNWIRPLVSEVSTGPSSVGVIGMCATGGLVLALMYDPDVGAAIGAQPAMPFRMFWTRRSRSAIGVDPLDLGRSSSSGTPLMITRFERDPVCPANRFRAIGDVFDEPSNDFRSIQFPGWRHATLTDDSDHAPGLFDEVVEFLASNLS